MAQAAGLTEAGRPQRHRLPLRPRSRTGGDALCWRRDDADRERTEIHKPVICNGDAIRSGDFDRFGQGTAARAAPGVDTAIASALRGGERGAANVACRGTGDDVGPAAQLPAELGRQHDFTGGNP
ncbi:hypothetical protein [Streptomyces sp. NPDC047061]|uniref:hypothetical protein n=1 Tax=Streptomyces sp. NPDC047061 TaxID=3154605 RepID=UPI0033C8EB6E